MEPGQEANNDNLVKYFRFSTQLYVEAILMSTLNIHFHDKIIDR